MIKKYSQLVLAKTEEEQVKYYLDLFKERAEKLKQKQPNVVFDPDVVEIDIRRWQLQKRKNNPEVKKQLEQYQNHLELHEAMKDYRTKREVELERQQQSSEGTEVLFKEGNIIAYKATTPPALSTLSQGSHWCVQNLQSAEQYLKDLGPFIVVHVNNEPYIAICGQDEQVWWWTDFDLRKGTNYAKYPADIMQEDLDRINHILSKLGKPKLVPEHFDVYPNLEAYKKEMLAKRAYARILINNRFEPEKIRELIPPGTTIQGDLDLSGKKITYLPEGLKVNGSLYLNGSGITSLPEGLRVNGSLYLIGNWISSLPERLIVEDSLYLSKTKITYIPKGLNVGMSLDLSGTPITSLPKGLIVNRDLTLNNTPINSLPEDLMVFGDLNLNETKITSLPEGLIVFGGLYGTNPKTGRPYQEEYNEMKRKR